MDNQVFESAAARTFQYQSSLPPLPVPALEESLQKYLDAVKPFTNEEEFRRTSAIVQVFAEGLGKELHQKLLRRARNLKNWLEEWWLDSAYLEVRIPSQLNVNFGGPAPYLEHCWPAKDGTQLERTSMVVWHTLQYWDLIRTERLAVHKAGRLPLDMNQFRMLYCTCKVPGITKDTIQNYFKTESEGTCPSHLVVMCRGRVFTFEAVFEGCILSPPEILRQITSIRERCTSQPDGAGVSALTTEERTCWAKAREHLIELDPNNGAILEAIQSSLFIVSLDDARPFSTPENYTEMILQALTGDPTARWGDKSYNIICFADGTFGSNCDHAPYDAMVLVSMCYYVDQKLKASEGRWKGSVAAREIPPPEELVFTVDQKAQADIALAKQRYRESARDLQVVSYAFTSFGKAAIKRKKLHPDTFVQLALQLAYYRLHRKPGSCYETATTRRFYHGRTETMRPGTLEALEWCKAMLDPSVNTETKRKCLLIAVAKHNKLMNEAQNGKGFDRHLLGLYLIAKGEGLPVPELYQDPAYSKSGGGGNFVLSTSLVGYTTVLGAVVPMVHHGYGFFYRIRDDRIVVSCTAWKSCPETDAEKLYQNLTTSFQEMLQLMTLSQL
ncbi:peroxisomal carnitine O-octanoyltransferase [Lepisosteus oculatus]|uniref:peroxisomal carnitine O-octanoyltransferase n=1 Tax=Lepisosteus oculatus TaxID=7918 RepID=UPI0035F50DDE